MKTVEFKNYKYVFRLFSIVLTLGLGISPSWGDVVQFSFNSEVVPLITGQGYCLVPTGEFSSMFGQVDVGSRVNHLSVFEKYCRADAENSKSDGAPNAYTTQNYGGLTYINQGSNFYLVNDVQSRDVADQIPFPGYRHIQYAWRLQPTDTAKNSVHSIRQESSGARKVGVQLVIVGKILHSETGGVTAISTGKETYWLKIDPRLFVRQPEQVQIAINQSDVLWAVADR